MWRIDIMSPSNEAACDVNIILITPSFNLRIWMEMPEMYFHVQLSPEINVVLKTGFTALTSEGEASPGTNLGGLWNGCSLFGRCLVWKAESGIVSCGSLLCKMYA